jgi:hypothetical protein
MSLSLVRNTLVTSTARKMLIYIYISIYVMRICKRKREREREIVLAGGPKVQIGCVS